MPAFRYRLPVRFSDVDHAGIVYYPRFFHYFHVAFEELWRARIGPRAYSELLDRDRVGFPAVRAECEFIAPLRFGDTAEIEVAVARLGGRSITFRYRVFRLDGADGADGADGPTATGADAAGGGAAGGAPGAADAPRTACAVGTVVCAVVDLARFVAIAVPERVTALLADLVEPAGDAGAPVTG